MSRRVRAVPHGLPAGAVSSTATVALDQGWQLASTEPGACSDPSDLVVECWSPAIVPGTVASVVDPGAHLDAHADYDARDWWYRCDVPEVRTNVDAGERVRLRFDGLATLATVWFNGERVLESSNMFLAQEVDVTDLVGDENDLVICFRSLGSALAERRPRPRWKTKLVDHQQLRWFRTTLLGRIPGWTPAIKPVGPWRPVWLEVVRGVDVFHWNLRTEWVQGTARVRLRASGSIRAGQSVLDGHLGLDGRNFDLNIHADGDTWSIDAELEVAGVEPWWPRTHGESRLYPCTVGIRTSDGPVGIEPGSVGFRSIEIDPTDDRIAFVVNGVPVFCRGACWTTNDIVSLSGDPTRMRRTLALAADANANMIRVGGTMVYESDAFYAACDDLGLMVWQDFMFANMDYPVEDDGFGASIRSEAEQQIGRLSSHPSVVAWCGGSEVEQQAAMFGAPREIWNNDFFATALPDLLEAAAPGAPYWPSTPTGGALPFHTGTGLTHYYGVGAYKRPIADCRLAAVKFTPECLGFSNVPEPDNLRTLTPDGTPAPHHQAWKAGVPRDSGAGWDFEDIRDHYLGLLYAVDPVELRSHDLDRYQRLSRVVTGRVMAEVFDEWRSAEHPCGGALVWFLQDLRPGAGWGIIDSDNRPKAAYHFLERAWAPVRVVLLDRGLDGLRIEVLNESAAGLEGELSVTIFGARSEVLASERTPIVARARGSTAVLVEEVVGHFADPTYAYRFGPPRHAAVQARFEAADGTVRAEALRWLSLAGTLPTTDLSAVADPDALEIASSSLARDVRVELRDGAPAGNYLDITPGRTVVVSVGRHGGQETALRGHVEAENAPDGTRIASRAESDR